MNQKTILHTLKVAPLKVIAFVLLPFIIYGLYYVYTTSHINAIYAVDPIQVTYNGGPPPAPMFAIINMFPGDEVMKDFNVKNASPDPQTVTVVATKITEEKNFSEVLDITITDQTNGSQVFTGKLSVLFADQVIALGQLAPDADKTFRVKVKFPFDSGDDYQLAKVTFNIVWRSKVNPDTTPEVIPDECKPFANTYTNVVVGTANNDVIYGTSANDLVYGLKGNDKIYGSGGNDCLVGSAGNDKLFGENGNDILVSGDGNDYIEGQDGDDAIFAGLGNDKIVGGFGNDSIYAGAGNDTVDARAGADTVFGEDGNDVIWGGSGNDRLYGGNGNDLIFGGNDDDFLYGNAGFDMLFGNFGNDTCSEGEFQNSCEY
jgi:Ca2+-binding RTX toxin-like protein